MYEKMKHRLKEYNHTGLYYCEICNKKIYFWQSPIHIREDDRHAHVKCVREGMMLIWFAEHKVTFRRNS